MSDTLQMLINVSAVLVGAYITYRALTDIGPKPKEMPLPKVPHFWSDDKSAYLLELDSVYRLEPISVQPLDSSLMVMQIGNGLLETSLPVLARNQETLSKVTQNAPVAAKKKFVSTKNQTIA